MTDETGYGVLTDAQWDELVPLIEQCRPPHKTEHDNLRRTIEAIVWRHANGAKWHSIPPHLGPWWMAAQTFPIAPRAARSGSALFSALFSRL
jgi:transposase